MRVAEMNWMQMEQQVARDDRCVFPVGSTEQHAQLSLCVDAILAERVALETAEPLELPVYPVMPYGLAPYFIAYPGTVSLRVETLLALARDVLVSMYRTGFRRILMVNGHGGNNPVGALALELMSEYPELVECSADPGEGTGDRSPGLPRELDGELPLDPSGPCAGTGRAQAPVRYDASQGQPPGRGPGAPGGRQLCRGAKF